MTDKKKVPGKKPVFNFYWIYIVIIVLLILMPYSDGKVELAKRPIQSFKQKC